MSKTCAFRQIYNDFYFSARKNIFIVRKLVSKLQKFRSVGQIQSQTISRNIMPTNCILQIFSRGQNYAGDRNFQPCLISSQKIHIVIIRKFFIENALNFGLPARFKVKKSKILFSKFLQGLKLCQGYMYLARKYVFLLSEINFAKICKYQPSSLISKIFKTPKNYIFKICLTTFFFCSYFFFWRGKFF